MKNNKAIIAAIICIAVTIVGIIVGMAVTGRFSQFGKGENTETTTAQEETTALPANTRPKSQLPDSVVASVYGSYSDKSAQDLAKFETLGFNTVIFELTGENAETVAPLLNTAKELKLYFGVRADISEGNTYLLDFVKKYNADFVILSGLDEAIVVSMGTGTAIMHAKRVGERTETKYLGGTGVGGGTLCGLSETMLGIREIEHLETLAENGDISKIDLRISDISKKDLGPTLDLDTTASNFGKLSDLATREDLALGIINLVFETIGMVSVFAARNFNIKNVVLTGKLSSMKKAKEVFGVLGRMFSMNFLFPENARYGTVIGAALLHFHKMRNA